ncbi:hypothetical protein Q428_02255 [Fervidicella metallireducens AeB]|uniref:Cell division protein ZapA n=1 Tax=Fervidicella metallireducens AeB TaxID=1403537 RepID=A0A017RXI8_9CLOT|nr:cell division protein ZapA [Fervidicella metallireducens]EYE89483.1 hypothetical protein Q428_02255 [Fervidicella metallireducens AeB]
MSKNKVIVRINGAEYTLTGDDSEDYLFSIANFVDKKVKEILTGNPKHSNTSAAVLTSLTITDELFRSRREIEVLKRSLNEPEEKLRQMKAEYEKLQRAYENLNNEYIKISEMRKTETENLEEIKNQYNELYQNLQIRNEEYEELLKENALLKEQNEKVEKEVKEHKDNIAYLKDQLLESQIELVRVKKDLKDIRDVQSKKRSI